MDIVTHKKDYTLPAIEQINMCRLYLKADTISDITDATGTRILDSALRCRALIQGTSRLWPKQIRPTNTTPWHSFLKTLCTKKAGILDIPLGRWLQSPLHRQWSAFHDSADNTVTFKSRSIWYTTKHVTHQRHQWDIHRPRRLYQNTYNPSPTSTPVAVSRSHNQLSISIPLPYTITPPPAPRSWKEHIKTCPPWEQHFLTKVKIPNPPALTAAIVTPSRIPILVVSDGSFKSPYGAFS